MAPSEPGLLVSADRVHTLDRPSEGDRTADALLIENGRIRAVGPRETLAAYARGAERLDLRGTTITPGLTDSHAHLLDWALARRDVDLAASATPMAAAEAVARHGGEPHTASTAPGSQAGDAEGDWIRGGGWDANRWGAWPTRTELDARVHDRPVALSSHDLHALWVNGRALERAGITAETPDPPGGRIVRDTAGEPTGVLLENAVTLVDRILPAPTDARARAAVLEAQAELHRLGITGVHSFPAVHASGLDPLRVLEQLRATDQLRLRILQQLPLSLLDDAVRLGLRSGFGGEWIRFGGVKMFLDGALGSRTAWLRAPYEGSDDAGIQVLPEPDFRDAVRRAAAAGLAATVHAIGDAAVELAIAGLEDPAARIEGADRPAGERVPHRIEHVQLCPPERLASIGRGGILCSMQPAHLISDWRPAERHWGHDRCRDAFAFRSLLRGAPAGQPGVAAAFDRPRDPLVGAVLAFGSDVPVEPVDPRLGLYAATVRQDLEGEPAGGWFAEERITVREALEAYTIGPARAAGMAGRRGRLVPGAEADFVAWDRDPLEAEGRDLLGLQCIATVVNGELVWQEES